MEHQCVLYIFVPCGSAGALQHAGPCRAPANGARNRRREAPPFQASSCRSLIDPVTSLERVSCREACCHAIYCVPTAWDGLIDLPLLTCPQPSYCPCAANPLNMLETTIDVNILQRPEGLKLAAHELQCKTQAVSPRPLSATPERSLPPVAAPKHVPKRARASQLVCPDDSKPANLRDVGVSTSSLHCMVLMRAPMSRF